MRLFTPPPPCSTSKIVAPERLQRLTVPLKQALPYSLKRVCVVLVEKRLSPYDKVVRGTVVLPPSSAFQRAEQAQVVDVEVWQLCWLRFELRGPPPYPPGKFSFRIVLLLV